MLDFGGNRDGKPLFRVVWGANHIVIPGQKDSVYTPDRWHMEKYHQGRYEHVYKFGQCQHMLPGDKAWCNKCWISGGEYVDITTHFFLVERAMHLFLLSEGLQNTALQKNALMEREAQKKSEQSQMVSQIVGATEVPKVKRSKQVNLKRRIRKDSFVPGFRQIHPN